MKSYAYTEMLLKKHKKNLKTLVPSQNALVIFWIIELLGF